MSYASEEDVIRNGGTSMQKVISGDSQEEDQTNSDVFSGAHALHIIETLEDEHAFRLEENSLKQILLSPEFVDKKVSIISVAGAFRKGKSFLLNFFLRYLNADVSDRNGGTWLDKQGPLTGFSWRGGSERETSGIMMWSKPFLVKNSKGEEVAVLLMDTQGAFDSQSTVKDCATIFALSTMLSSTQIYNLSQNVQENDLQHLQLFTEYGRLALESTDAKPFQTLLFLVRDWSFPYEAEYGFSGGENLLERRLQITDKQHPEHQQLRQHIRSCFDRISCFLMPHPGLEVASSSHFCGQIKDIELNFQKELKVLIPHLLDPENLVLKRINGQEITCRELLEYFRVYINIFQDEDLPEPKSMLMATAEANNLAAVSSSKAHYMKKMEEVCGGDAPYIDAGTLDQEHERCLNEAVHMFKSARKMGGNEFSLQFLERLNSDIEEQYENFKKVNNGKNVFRSMFTPLGLFVSIVCGYLCQEFFQMIGIDSLANMCFLIIWMLIIALSTYMYSVYSGKVREARIAMDNAVLYAWNNFLASLTQQGMHRAIDVGHRIAQVYTHMHLLLCQ
uniref:GB1/RHD3-type G domain-containing protein n=1 Tax=Syphacia muris TaxID=451379 RepID=A0A0N5APN3_9BILA